MYPYTEKNEYLQIFRFSLAKNGAGADPKRSAPASALILNQLRLRNTADRLAAECRSSYLA